MRNCRFEYQNGFFFKPLSRCVEEAEKSLHFHESKPCRSTINLDGYITLFSSHFVTIKFRGEIRVFYDTHFIMYKKNMTQARTHFGARWRSQSHVSPQSSPKTDTPTRRLPNTFTWKNTAHAIYVPYSTHAPSRYVFARVNASSGEWRAHTLDAHDPRVAHTYAPRFEAGPSRAGTRANAIAVDAFKVPRDVTIITHSRANYRLS